MHSDPYDEEQVALVIDPDGNKRLQTFTNRLPDLQALVGGYVQMVRHPSEIEMAFLCDEDGISLGLEPNPTATAIVNQLGFCFNGRLLGPIAVVFVRRTVIREEDGLEEIFISPSDEILSLAD